MTSAPGLVISPAGGAQREFKALDWVVSPQRVTTLTAGDFDVCGWPDGILVSFGIRGGRLRQWYQRRCSTSQAPWRAPRSRNGSTRGR
jgi:excinuclease ABC subunit C